MTRRIEQFCLGAALITALLSGYSYTWYSIRPFRFPVEGNFFALLTLLLLGVGLWAKRWRWQALPFTPLPSFHISKNLIRMIRVGGLGVVCLGIVAETGRRAFFQTLELSTHLQFILYVTGAILLCIALGVRLRVDPLPLIVIGAIGVGAIFRVYRLGELVHLPIDELHFIEAVNHLRGKPTLPLFDQMPSLASFPNLYPYLENWTVTLLSPLLGSLGALRVVSVIVGLATIPAIYLLGRELYDERVGLIAAWILALYPPHIHFSRSALNNIADPLFGVLAFAYGLRAWRTGASGNYVLAGACLALSGLFYEGGRWIFFGVFIAYSLFWMISYRRMIPLHGVVITGIAYLALSAPYLWILTSPDYYFAPRLVDMGSPLNQLLRDFPVAPLSSVIDHWNNSLQYTIYHIIYSSDGSRYYYGGRIGLVAPILVPFFLLGLWSGLYRGVRRSLLLIGWLALTVIGVSLIESVDWSARFVVIFPAIALASAVGMQFVGEVLIDLTQRDGLARRVVAGLVLVVSGVTVVYYFTTHIPFYQTQVRREFYDVYDAYYTLSDPPIPTTIYFMGVPRSAVLESAVSAESRLRRLDIQYEVLPTADSLTAGWLASLPTTRRVVFAIAPNQLELIDWVKKQGVTLSQPLPRRVDTVPEDRRFLLYVRQ
jgi:hypothetical protein